MKRILLAVAALLLVAFTVETASADHCRSPYSGYRGYSYAPSYGYGYGAGYGYRNSGYGGYYGRQSPGYYGRSAFYGRSAYYGRSGVGYNRSGLTIRLGF